MLSSASGLYHPRFAHSSSSTFDIFSTNEHGNSLKKNETLRSLGIYNPVPLIYNFFTFEITDRM